MAADYKLIPKITLESLQAWIKHGVLPGSFLQAVLKNDLIQAIPRADRHNLAAIVEICAWVRNEAPIGSWGSRELVEQWERRKRGDRLARAVTTVYE